MKWDVIAKTLAYVVTGLITLLIASLIYAYNADKKYMEAKIDSLSKQVEYLAANKKKNQ